MRQDILKGVYYALVLTVRNPRKISKSCQKQSNVNAPWVCYTCRNMPMPLVYLYANGNIGCVRIVIDTGVGFCVARSDKMGHS